MAEEDPPRPADIDVDVDGDVAGDLIVAGDDVFIQRVLNLPRPAIWGGLAALVAIVAALGILVVPGFIPPFRAAAEDEVLVIVTDFNGSDGEAASARIYRELSDRVQRSDLQDVRVERLEGEAPQQAAQASAIGERFNATLVIWGTADGHAIEPFYEVVRHGEDIAQRTELGATLATDAPAFSAYVVAGVPNEFEYLMLTSLGQIAYFGGDYTAAADLFQQATEIDLGERAAALNQDAAYIFLGAARYGISGDAEATLADIEQALDINPDSPEAIMTRGVYHYYAGDLEAALADIDRVIELDPDDAGPLYSRGYILFLTGDVEGALADIDRAIEVDPENAEAYAVRAEVLFALGDVEGALADQNRSIELAPQLPHTYVERGVTHFVLGDDEAAFDDYERAIDIDPQLAGAYYARALTYDELGDDAAALADFQQFLTLYEIEDESSAYARQRVVELGG